MTSPLPPLSRSTVFHVSEVILDLAASPDGVWPCRPGTDGHKPLVWQVYENLENRGLIWRTGFARGDRIQFVLNFSEI